MSSGGDGRQANMDVRDQVEMLHVEDALEEIEDDGDVPMDSDDDQEITLSNDSIAYMDSHKSSVFCIAAHPLMPSLIATGGSEGEDDDSPGMGYVLDTSSIPDTRPVLPASYSTDPLSTHSRAPTHLRPLYALQGHADSINAVTFTQPEGKYLVTGGLDGRLRAWAVKLPSGNSPARLKFWAEAQEVKEINFIAPSPSATYPNTFAIGASDGSVWVYTMDKGELSLVQSYFTHSSPVTAGAWSPDGNLLATVDEEGALYVWDIFGVAAAKGLANFNGGTSVVALTPADSRFAVDGGLYAVAIDPKGRTVAVGGATGEVRVISLPSLDAQPKDKGKRAGEGQPGQILASLSVQTDGIETLAFAPEPLTLLAAGSVDGSIAVFDTSRQCAMRRHLVGAHDEHAVVKVEWVKNQPWFLSSCGVDGVVRRWDLRAGSSYQAEPNMAIVREWRGHRGDGEGGGVMGFVQADDGRRVVTAGDDGVVLVFEA
ncbi:WD40 repeat-like protein [Zalerion maritima]|uniref:WD40 repeat-like protein n=1 Tax=Zalerion maritima TaxID=339359 RepID=A0AAD5WNH0_9PEZI|nr:WD40 repeat-like protein [Zalerion maritima]